MGIINILPKSVYNRISAGEVVERPASVVKELFENAIDAGASNIIVSIERGGLDEIFVSDDGKGMTKDDLPKAFLPHATSKINRAEDLDNIVTLGFRGEAIASIASVSECRISTKLRADDVGYTLTSIGGSLGNISEAPCTDGTSVTVSRLFFNTPARLKFLKSDKSEEREVTSTMEKLILANPDVSVKYFADDKLVLQSFGGGEEDAALAVYGGEFIDKCYKIYNEANGICVKGYIGNTNFYKANRTYQTVIVNGRFVEDKTVSLAVGNAYSSYLMKRQFPVYVLSIVVPPEILDVNVHP
ncbi:MAG: DNA mismatch repair endonuclease MutL, partial [Clostridia bacterium]|nr:DNA mismatch repair endonuclease MutL [Clostridia bacterium]